MDKQTKKNYAFAFENLKRAASGAGVSEEELNRWEIQHIDDSLSRLVRVTPGAMKVIATFNHPSGVSDLMKLYPPREEIVFQNGGFRLVRDEVGFTVYVGDSSVPLADEHVLKMMQNTIQSFNYKKPRDM